MNGPALAIEFTGTERIFVTVPAGEIIEVTEGLRHIYARMVDVRWNKREMVMFVADLYARCDYVDGRTAGA